MGQENVNEGMENPSGFTSDGLFTPKSYKDGYPTCYGHFINGRRCDCKWFDSCRIYTHMNKAERRRDIHYENFETVPLLDNVDFTSDDKALSTMVSKGRESYTAPDGREIAVDDVNLDLIKICVMMAIEHPQVMQAFILKLDPRVRCLQDIADIMGVTKQAIQRRIATELGVGKKSVKDATLLKLGSDGVAVFDAVFRRGKSLRETAAELKMPLSRVREIVADIKKKGIKSRTEDADI